ncbi:MAG: hypothetical protein V3R88_08890 [Alphaproteobacteria bacterium]
MEREIKRQVSDEERAAVIGDVLSKEVLTDRRKRKRQIRKAMKVARAKELSK